MFYTSTFFGYESPLVQLEIDVRHGIPSVDLVGLADSCVKESRERVLTALRNSEITIPQERILVCLNPCDLKKDNDVSFPLAMAMADSSNPVLFDVGIMGELELSGRVRPVRGVYAFIQTLRENGIKKIILPNECRKIAETLDSSILEDSEFLFVSNLKECFRLYADENNYINLSSCSRDSDEILFNTDEDEEIQNYLDLHNNCGSTVRALQIALSGKHNIMGYGELYEELFYNLDVALNPLLTDEELSAVRRLYSLSGIDKTDCTAPLRRPHFTATIEGMCGGGINCRPGEISLAHNGILYLGKASEFRSSCLQMLRVPLESRRISLSRAGRSTVYPADFSLHLFNSPCPCGNYGSKNRICLCSAKSVEQFWKKISAPILDRIEIKIHTVTEKETELSLNELREPIRKAFEIQRKRKIYNGKFSSSDIIKYCKLDESAENFKSHLSLSDREEKNLVKVALTIANMDGREFISLPDIEESYSLINFNLGNLL